MEEEKYYHEKEENRVEVKGNGKVKNMEDDEEENWVGNDTFYLVVKIKSESSRCEGD